MFNFYIQNIEVTEPLLLDLDQNSGMIQYTQQNQFEPEVFSYPDQYWQQQQHSQDLNNSSTVPNSYPQVPNNSSTVTKNQPMTKKKRGRPSLNKNAGDRETVSSQKNLIDQVPNSSQQVDQIGSRRRRGRSGSIKVRPAEISIIEDYHSNQDDQNRAGPHFSENDPTIVYQGHASNSHQQASTIKIKIPNYQQERVPSLPEKVPNFQERVPNLQDNVTGYKEVVTNKTLKRKSNASLDSFEDVSEDQRGQLSQNYGVQKDFGEMKKPRFSLPNDAGKEMNSSNRDSNVAILYEQLGKNSDLLKINKVHSAIIIIRLMLSLLLCIK